MNHFFTSESVTCGHPDKVCDIIADSILDAVLAEDADSRVACEVTCATDQVHVFGEMTTEACIDIESIVRDTIRSIGYTEKGRGFDAESCRITIDLHGQSPDIARGISRMREQDMLDNGAGDQGIMFGYACRETDGLMPLPIELAHSLARRLEQVRRTGELGYLLPDGKTQVTVEYNDKNEPINVSAIVVSAQHRENIDIATVRKDIFNHVILPVVPHHLLNNDTQYYINPTGRFVIGGPSGDSGLTGRKLIVDSYGGYAHHGGGAISGKDASKVDRSGAYMARYIAKNVVAQGLADRCEVQIGYAIGLAEPMGIYVNTFGTGKLNEKAIYDAILDKVDMRPMAIIRRFGLNRPIFRRTACYGQFGSNAVGLPWEATDLEDLMG